MAREHNGCGDTKECSHLQGSQQKRSLWIRPHGSSLHVYTMKTQVLSFPLKRKRAVYVTLDVLGILTFLTVFGFLLLHTGIGTQVSVPFCQASNLCTATSTSSVSTSHLLSGSPSTQSILHQNATPTQHSGGASSSTPVVFAPTATATPLPLHDAIPTSAPGAVLQASSSSFIGSYTSLCERETALSISLMNVGSASLLWWQDQKGSTGNLHVTAPNNVYVIHAGQQENIFISCSKHLGSGHYHVKIDSNGGSVSIDMVIRD